MPPEWPCLAQAAIFKTLEENFVTIQGKLIDFHGARHFAPSLQYDMVQPKQAAALSKIHNHQVWELEEQLTRRMSEIFYIGVTCH